MVIKDNLMCVPNLRLGQIALKSKQDNRFLTASALHSFNFVILLARFRWVPIIGKG